MLFDFIDVRTANVYGICGHLGGGKTLTAVQIMRWMLEKGWPVSSNVRVVHDGLKGDFNFIEDFQFCDFWSLPCGAPRGSPSSFRAAVVIDEAAEFFDQYTRDTPQVHNFLSWLRHCSKRGQFCFLIVQNRDFLNANLRKLIHKWIICDDMEQMRLPVLKVRIPFTRNFVARRVFDKYGNLLSRGFNFADKRDVGRFYDTAQSIAVAGRNNDYQFVAEPYDPNLFFYNLVLVLLLVFYLFYG